MDLPSYLSFIGSLGSLPLNYLLYGVGGFALLMFIIWALSRFSAHRNEWGTGLERKVENEAGVKPFRRFFRGSLRTAIGLGSGTYAVYKLLSSRAKVAIAAIRGAKASGETEKSAEALEAIKGRALGLIAGLKLIEEALEKYAGQETAEEAKEENEAEFIDKLAAEIGEISNYDRIDENVLIYLKKLMEELLAGLKENVSIKRSKDFQMKNLLMSLRVAIPEIKSVLREARAEDRIFRKFERKSRKDYSADVKALSGEMKRRKKELKKARKAGKKADFTLISTLEKEIALLEKQCSAANSLNSQLKVTYSMLDNEAKSLKKLIRKLLKYEKQIVRAEQLVYKTEPNVSKKTSQLAASLGKFEELAKSLESNSDAHFVALSLSGGLNVFFKENEELFLLTDQFDKLLRSILLIGYSMARNTESYERLIEAMTQAEETIDQGMDVLIKIIQSVVTDPNVQVSEQEVSTNLERLNKLLDSQRNVDTYLKNLAGAVRYKLGTLYSLIERLSNRELQLAALSQRYSGYIGRVMGTAFNRKLEIDKSYMSQAETFERVLQQRNETAYAAYSQARAA